MVVALVSAGNLLAQPVVNIDFNFPGREYTGQGAVIDTGNDFWNPINSAEGGAALFGSDGSTSTSISISLVGVAGLGPTTTPSLAGHLLADYLYSYNSASFVISGLTAGQAYEFYFYSVAGGSNTTDRATAFVLNGKTQTASGLKVASFIEGTN